MTKAEKLKEIIGLAVNAGWSELWKGKPDNLAIVENEHGLTVWIDERTYSPESIIFRHDFLKAYFGEAMLITDVAMWQIHAQELVLAEDYIEYLWKHRPKS